MHRQRYVYDQLILCQKRLSYADNSTVMVNSYNEYYKHRNIYVVSSQECWWSVQNGRLIQCSRIMIYFI